MNRKLLLTAVAVFMLFQAMTVFAAPKQMPDGGTFDPDYYAATYADVRAVCGNNENLLYTHYKVCGAKEGRHPFAVGATTTSTSSSTTTDDFDAAYYASKYPDLVAAFGNDATKLYQHWIAIGKKEGRIAKEPVKASSSSSGSSGLDSELSNNANLAKQVNYLVNVYRLQKDRKELKLNEQLNVAATRLAIDNEARDKSSSHTGNDKDYKKLAKESSYMYDEIDCSHFEKNTKDAQKIFEKLLEEDEDMLKEKVYRDMGFGKCDEFYVIIFADEDDD